MTSNESALEKCMSVDCPYIAVGYEPADIEPKYYCDFIPMTETLDYVTWCHRWPENTKNEEGANG